MIYPLYTGQFLVSGHQLLASHIDFFFFHLLSLLIIVKFEESGTIYFRRLQHAHPISELVRAKNVFFFGSKN